MSACKSCGAQIIWARTEHGRRIPLDAEPYHGPSPAGLFVLREARELALAVPPDVFPTEPHYRSHFATCPEAGSWRR